MSAGYLIASGLWLLGIMLAIYAVRSIIRSVKLPAGGVPVPRCRACRYPAINLRGHTCPECGGDLRGSGVVPPREQLIRITNLKRAAFGWTVLVGVVLLAAAHIGWPLLVRSAGLARRFEQHVILTPASERYRTINVHRLVDSRERFSEIRLVLKTLDDREHELRYTADGRITTSVSGSPKVFTTRDNATIVHLWMNEAKVVMHEEVLRLELQQLIDWLDDARTLGDAPISVTKFTRYWVDPRKVQVTAIPPDARVWVGLMLVLLGAPVVWCIGLVAIMQANRRVLARADCPKSASNAQSGTQ